MKTKLTVLLVAFLLLFASRLCLADDTVHYASPSLKIDFPSPGSIIQFFLVASVGDSESENQVGVYLLVPGAGKYKNFYVGTIGATAPDTVPEIESVFLENVDETPEKELFIITSSKYYHDNGSTDGYNYNVYIYKHPGAKLPFSGFVRLQEVEREIGWGYEGRLEGKRYKAPYKNAADVRKILKTLGY